MCYLIAKDRDAHGCFALKTTHGRHLVELKRELNRAVGYKGVQLVTISRPTAYGEYAPYHFVDTEEVFVDLKIKKAIKKENWVKECNSIQRECKSLLDKVFYRLYVRDFYLSRIEYVHQKTSYLFAGSNIGFGDITICDKIDYYGDSKKLSVDILKDFEKVNINNPSYKYLSSILKIEEKSHRFIALYQYLIENKTIRDFVDWIKEENLIEEYGIKILNNPDENYRHQNEELTYNGIVI